MYHDGSSKGTTVIDPVKGLILDESESQVSADYRSTGVDERDDGDRFDEHFYGGFRTGMTRAEVADLLDENERDYTPAEFMAAAKEHAPDARFGVHCCTSMHRDLSLPDRTEAEITATVCYGLDMRPATLRAGSLRELLDLLVAGCRAWRAVRQAEMPRASVGGAGMMASA